MVAVVVVIVCALRWLLLVGWCGVWGWWLVVARSSSGVGGSSSSSLARVHCPLVLRDLVVRTHPSRLSEASCLARFRCWAGDPALRAVFGILSFLLPSKEADSFFVTTAVYIHLRPPTVDTPAVVLNAAVAPPPRPPLLQWMENVFCRVTPQLFLASGKAVALAHGDGTVKVRKGNETDRMEAVVARPASCLHTPTLHCLGCTSARTCVWSHTRAAAILVAVACGFEDRAPFGDGTWQQPSVSEL